MLNNSIFYFHLSFFIHFNKRKGKRKPNKMNNFMISDKLETHDIFDIHDACEVGDLSLFRSLIDKERSELLFDEFWANWMSKACELNYLPIVEYILEKNSHPSKSSFYEELLNDGLHEACAHHHDSIITLLIEKGANDWNEGFFGACRGGHIDLVQDMIKRGVNSWNQGFGQACREGHEHIVQLLLNQETINFDYGLGQACRGGFLRIVDLMIDKGATDFNCGLVCACKGGHQNIVQRMIQKGAKDWHKALFNACRFGHSELIKFLMSHEPLKKTNWKTIWNVDWNVDWIYDHKTLDKKIFLFQSGVSVKDLGIKTHDEWCWFLNNTIYQFETSPPWSVFQKRMFHQQMVFHTIQSFVQHTNLQHISKLFISPCFPFE